jgi:hypothetical protein
VTQSKLTLADFLKSFEKLLLLGAVSDNVWIEDYSSTNLAASLETDEYLNMAMNMEEI